MKNILVAGATGRTGRIIVEKIIERSHKPNVLVRDLAAAQILFSNSVTYHQGDVRDAETILPCLPGINIVISSVGSNIPVGPNCPKRVDYEGITNLVQAAHIQGVERFILISSIAVTRPDHPLNRFGRVLEWKFRAESFLRGSGLRYTIIRPGGLTDIRGGTHQLTFSQGDRVIGTVSRSDLAEACLHALDYPQSKCTTFEIIENGEVDGKPGWTELFSNLTPDRIGRPC